MIMKKILLIICMLFPLSGWVQEIKKSEDLSKAVVMKEGDLCPEFVFKNTEGKEVSLKQFKGKYVVIDVWASWCAPCKQEFPNMKKLEEKYKDRNIVFVSISCDQTERRWRNELGFLHDVVKYQWWIAGNETFMTAFEVAAIPRLILLDKKGRVVNLRLPKPSDPEFEKILSKLKGL